MKKLSPKISGAGWEVNVIHRAKRRVQSEGCTADFWWRRSVASFSSRAYRRVQSGNRCRWQRPLTDVLAIDQEYYGVLIGRVFLGLLLLPLFTYW